MLGPEDQDLKNRHEDATAEAINELLDMLRVLRGALQLPHELPGGAAGFDGLDPKIREALGTQDNDFAADAGDLPSPEDIPGLGEAVADFAKAQRPWYKRVFDAVAGVFGRGESQSRAPDEGKTLKPPKELSPEAVLKRLETGEPVENIRREMNVARGPVTPATLAQAHNQVVRFLEKLWQVDLPQNVRTDSGFGWRIEALERLCRRLLNIQGGGKVSVVNDESGIGIYVPKDDELAGTGFVAQHVRWGKATAAWAAGNTVTLDPCDEDGNDNGQANITGYIESPTGATPTNIAIAQNDILAYLPREDGDGTIVNVHRPHRTAMGDGVVTLGSTQGTQDTDTYTWTGTNGVSLKVITDIQYNTTTHVLAFRTRQVNTDKYGHVISVGAESALVNVTTAAACP